MLAVLSKSRREMFDELFLELTGKHPDRAFVGEDGFLFISPTTNLSQKPLALRSRITALAGPNGWRNHLIDDKYAGWWIRRPAK